MPQLDAASYWPQLVWLAITFAALYLLMAKLALPRIADVLEERSKRREDDLARAEELQGAAQAAAEAYDLALGRARGEANAQLVRSAEAAKVSAEAAIDALDQRLAGEIESAEATIAASRDAALTEAATIAGEAARLAAEKIAGIEVDAGAAAAAALAASKAGP